MSEQRRGGAVEERMSVLDFQQAIRAGRFVPGDAVLYRWGHRNPLAWAIERVQRRALADLERGRGETASRGDGETASLLDGAAYTHAGMIIDAEISAEMTAPLARIITWERRLRAGDRILVVRPIAAPGVA